MTTDLTAQDIEELKRLEKAAAGAPWELESVKTEVEHDEFEIFDAKGHRIFSTQDSEGGHLKVDFDRYDCANVWNELSRKNAAFTITARNAIPSLLSMVERLQTENAELRGESGFTDDRPMSEEEEALIDQAWENHKAARRIAVMKNNNMEGRMCLVEMEPGCTVEVGAPLFAKPVLLDPTTELATLRRQIAECKATLELATASHNTLVSQIAEKDVVINDLRSDLKTRIDDVRNIAARYRDETGLDPFGDK